MREQQTSKPRGRRRAVLVTVAVSLMVSMALPLTGYFAYEAGLLQSAQAQESKDEEANTGAPCAAGSKVTRLSRGRKPGY
jgi:hypothetical protein